MPRHINMRDVPCRPAGDPQHRAVPIRNLGVEFAGMLQTPEPMEHSERAMPSDSPIQAPSRLSLGPLVRELGIEVMDLPAEEQVLPAEEQVLPAEEQVLPAEEQVVQVLEGSPIAFTMEVVGQSEPNEGQLGDQAVGQLGDQAVGQLGNQAVGLPGDQAVELVDQALAYFRNFYTKDGQLVSFSFPVSRALRKDDQTYAKHWGVLIVQRAGEHPGETEWQLENNVGKKIQSHVRNSLRRTEPGKKPKKIKVQQPPAQKGLPSERGIPVELLQWFRYFAILFQLFYKFSSFAICNSSLIHLNSIFLIQHINFDDFRAFYGGNTVKPKRDLKTYAGNQVFLTKVAELEKESPEQGLKTLRDRFRSDRRRARQ